MHDPSRCMCPIRRYGQLDSLLVEQSPTPLTAEVLNDDLSRDDAIGVAVHPDCIALLDVDAVSALHYGALAGPKIFRR